jgi:hypothetical protein
VDANFYDLFNTDQESLAQERAQALQQLLSKNRTASTMAALSGAKSMQPFAQMTGQLAQQQEQMLGQAGGARLKATMQQRQQEEAMRARGQEREEAMRARGQEREEDRAFRAHESGLSRALQRELAKLRASGGDDGPLDEPLTAALTKLGLDPAVYRTRGEGMKAYQNARLHSVALSRTRHEWEKVEKDELTPAQNAAVADYYKGMELMTRLLGEKEAAGFNTGPIMGRGHALAREFGWADSTKAGWNTELKHALVTYIKSISGAAVTDNEREYLKKIMPNINMQDDEFKEAATRFINRLKELKGIELENLARSGRNVDAYREGAAPPQTHGAGPKAPPNDLRSKYGL